MLSFSILSNLHLIWSFKTFPEVSSEAGRHHFLSWTLLLLTAKAVSQFWYSCILVSGRGVLSMYSPVLLSLYLHSSNYNTPLDSEFIPGPAVHHKQPRSRRQGLKEARLFNNKLVTVSLFRSHTDTVHLVGNLKKEETMAPLIGHGAQSLWGHQHSGNSAGRPPPNRTSIQYGYNDLPSTSGIFLVNVLMLAYW